MVQLTANLLMLEFVLSEFSNQYSRIGFFSVYVEAMTIPRVVLHISVKTLYLKLSIRRKKIELSLI